MDYDFFKDYYKKHGMAMGDAFRRKNKYTEKELQTRYKKYMKTHDSNNETEQQKLRKQALKRDNNECQFCKLIPYKNRLELETLNKSIGQNGLDMAHVFEKSVYPNMKNDLDNVVMLKRVIHNRLDTGKDPITGEKVAPEVIEAYWELIVGSERFYKLKKKIGINEI